MSEDGVKKSSNPQVAFWAGCIAGSVECVAVWPMEYMKTQLQLQAGAAKPAYTGLVGGFRYTINTTGFLSLYKGLDSALVGAFPKAGIRFGANDYLKNLLKDKKTGKLVAWQQFSAGFGAGLIEAIFAVTPMETVKVKLIEQNLNFIPGVRAIFAESGLSGFYQGLVPTMLKQGSNQGLRFMAFNIYKDIVTKEGKVPMNPLMSLAGGMMAGCFSTICNNPIDVVKTQMQGVSAAKYTSSLDCCSKIYAADGIAGFYKGCVPRMGRVVPGQGLIFMSFELIQEFVEKSFFSAKK